ncbi:MAG TPA: ABC transporter substrate-binding protein [Candidatus Methylomirabilis sp.]|nr:ABC transporter substrate-binding protein [Candidatus Methylomirabilis sp.]
MSRSRVVGGILGGALAASLIVAGVAVTMAQAPKHGGVIKVMLREDLPQGFAIHETSTYSTSFPALPCFNNLVFFDPSKPIESADTVVGDLAEKWTWHDNYRTLAFVLRKDVKWHDGQPFSSKDVKYTFDLLREAPGVTAKLRINPRKDWYANVEAVEAPDPHTVLFRLKRPQPSLLLMLASGYSPIYAAHIPPGQYRTSCVGTGPFKLRAWRKGDFVEYVKNPDYFIKDRPYLDGIRFVIIIERATRTAALQAGQIDAASPGETTKASMEQLRKAVPRMVFHEVAQSVSDNIIMNTTKPPFDNAKIRLAVSYAIDRRALIHASHRDGAVLGSAMLPKPYGVWGMPEPDLLALPGYGKTDEMRARARKLLAEVGVTADKPLKVEMVTRAISIYIDMASFVINELRQVGIEATLKLVETAQWHAMATRGQYQMGANLTGVGTDDPDANFFENYACGSPRNYSQYCDEDVTKMIERQSQELDPKKRLEMVIAIQKRVEADAARPILAQRLDYYAHWPYVKDLVPHNNVYNFSRFQDVWLDK